MSKLVALILTVSQALAFDYALTAKEINAQTYCFFGEPQAMNKVNNGNMVNTCFYDMGKSWIVIDSGPTYAYAQQAHSIIKKIKNQKISYVFNTHIHDDHWLGNGYYKALGIKILGSNLFEEDVDITQTTRMQTRITKEAYQGTEPTLPTHLIGKGKKLLTIEDKTIQIIAPKGASHTKGDLIIYLTNTQTLFAGDIVFNDRIPSLRDGNIYTLIQTLEFINSLKAKYIIGGHGYNTSKDATAFTLNYLNELKKKVSSAIDEGLDIDEAIQSIIMSKFKDNAMYKTLHKSNVGKAYRTMEWSDE